MFFLCWKFWNIPALEDAKEFVGIVGAGAMVSIMVSSVVLAYDFWTHIRRYRRGIHVGTSELSGVCHDFLIGWVVFVRLVGWWPTSLWGRIGFGVVLGLEIVVLFLTWTRTAWLVGLVFSAGLLLMLFGG